MLSKRNKKMISEDWLELYPTLGIYKPMHLLNRIGPLVMGIYLKVCSDGESYQPVFHVHNLLKEFPVVSLELYSTILHKPIEFKHHKMIINDYVIKFNKKILIPLEDNVSLERILKGYRDYLQNPTYPHQISVYEDMFLLSIWCNNQALASECLNLARKHMKKWPSYIIERIGGVDFYINQLLYKYNDLGILQNNYDNQIKSLKLENIPIRELIS